MKKTTTIASKKTTVKAATKKTTTVKKETVTKKTTAKTTYKPVKMNLQVQYNYHDVSLDDIEKMVIDHLVELGYKKTSILTLDIYYKAETSEIFYIAKTNNNQVLKNDEPLYIYFITPLFNRRGLFLLVPSSICQKRKHRFERRLNDQITNK